MMNNIHTIFTFSTNNKNDNKSIEALFSGHSKNVKKGTDLVYNISTSKNNLNIIIDAATNKEVIALVNSFKVYFYYPNSGFQVFIVKNKNTSTVNKTDLYLLKNQISKSL